MKIAVPADAPDLETRVGSRLGASPYLLIVDAETMTFEALPNPGASGPGIGMETVALSIGRKVDAVLTGYCSPIAERYLSVHGIDVLSNISGTVSQAVQQYQQKAFQKIHGTESSPEAAAYGLDKATFLRGLRHSFNQFASMMPPVAGIVLLMGFFNACVSREWISAVFTGNRALDTLWGACLGALFSGNAINSYIIGGELLDYGVSLYAVTAFMISWVSVGLVQLPAEISALGARFALVRNGASFVFSIATAIAVVAILNLTKVVWP